MSDIRVLVIEDDPEFAEQFCQLIDAHPDFAPPRRASCLREAQHRLTASSYDILAIDLELPDGNGVDLIADTRIEGRKIVVSLFGDESSVVRAIEAGADGFVTKDNNDLVGALLAIHNGHAPLSASVAAHILRRFRELAGPAPSAAPAGPLSPRETETLQALAMGLTYQETADRLGISRHTAADHVKSIYRKLSVKTSAAAVCTGISAGLISVPKPP